MIFKRAILCAYNIFEAVEKRYPNRTVFPEMHCENDSFYYFSRKGNVRKVLVKDRIVLACDYDRGPYYMKKIWPIKRPQAHAQGPREG